MRGYSGRRSVMSRSRSGRGSIGDRTTMTRLDDGRTAADAISESTDLFEKCAPDGHA